MKLDALKALVESLRGLDLALDLDVLYAVQLESLDLL